MKKLLLSTALVLATTGAALAQDTVAFRAAPEAMEIYASEFIGKRVYAAEAELDADAYNGIQQGWEDIGEINDVILARDGSVQAVLVDVGGFLGIGERQVAVNMPSLRFVSDEATPEDLGDFFLVMAGNRAAIEAAPEYQRIEMSGATMTTGDQAMAPGTTTAPADGTVATAPADGTAATAPANGATAPAMISRDGYAAAENEYLTAEKLTGANVYDANDKDIGNVSELVLGADGQITQAVVDVGGFLGMGAKPVALDLSALNILRKVDGDDVRVYVNMTNEQLKSLPDFGG